MNPLHLRQQQWGPIRRSIVETTRMSCEYLRTSAGHPGDGFFVKDRKGGQLLECHRILSRGPYAFGAVIVSLRDEEDCTTGPARRRIGLRELSKNPRNSAGIAQLDTQNTYSLTNPTKRSGVIESVSCDRSAGKTGQCTADSPRPCCPPYRDERRSESATVVEERNPVGQ